MWRTGACQLEGAQNARNARGLLPHGKACPLKHARGVVQHRRLPCHLHAGTQAQASVALSAVSDLEMMG